MAARTASTSKWVRSLPAAKQQVLEWATSDKGWTVVTEDRRAGICISAMDHTTIVKREDRSAPKLYIRKEKTYKIWKCVAEVDAGLDIVCRTLTDIAHANKWNTVVENARIISTIDPSTDLVWYSSKSSAAGTIARRDFVTVRRSESQPDGSYLIISTGAIHPDVPPREGMVRGWNNAGGFLVRPLPLSPESKTSTPTKNESKAKVESKTSSASETKKAASTRCSVTWILNVDARISVIIPRALIDSTMADVTSSLVDSLREALESKARRAARSAATGEKKQTESKNK